MEWLKRNPFTNDADVEFLTNDSTLVDTHGFAYEDT
jgi:hypothetical protein